MLGGAPVTLATAPPNTAFRGVALAPVLPPPLVSSITRASSNPTNGSSVNFTVTFNQPVSGVDTTDFSLTTTGVSGASVSSVMGGPSVYTVAVNTGTLDGTIRLDLTDDDSIKNVQTTPLGGPGAGNGSFNTGEIYTVDKTAPTVMSIARAGGSPTNASMVTFNVTFSEAVTGVDAADFALATGGTIAGASISMVTGAGSSWMVVVSTGTGSGTIGLNLVDDDTIVDAATNPLGGVGAGNGNLTGEVYAIDRTAPVVSNVMRVNGTPTNAASVAFSVDFSEPVSGVDATDFALATTGSVTGASITSVMGVANQFFTVVVNTGSGDGTLGLNVVDDDTIVDGVANPLGGPGAGNGSVTGPTYTIDKTPPSVTYAARDDNSPTNASSVGYNVSFNEPVTGVDATDFTLTTTGGVTGASVTNVIGSGANYFVTLNTGTGNGTIRLDVLDDDTIMDAVGNTTASAFTSAEVYTIDKTAPTVSSSVRANSNPTNASSVNFTVTFSEDVTGVNAADFALTTTGTIAGASISNVSAGTNTYTVTVMTGTGEGTIRLDVVDDDSIVDAATNKLGGTGAGNGNFTAGEAYTIDRTAPTAVSAVRAGASPTNASSVNFTVTFSESVTGVDANDFALVTTGVTGATISMVSGSGTTWTVTVATGTGDGTIRLDLSDDDSIVDAAGNPLGGAGTGNGNITGEVYTIDKTVPTVLTSVRNGASPTTASSVSFTVTFSEAVTGVDAADFTLTTTGVTGASISTVMGSGTTYAVAVNTGSGSGTIRLDVVDNDSVVDAATNPLGGAGAGNGGFTTGEVYTIDRTPPTVASIVRANPNPTNATSVDFTVTFSESVTGVDVSDFNIVPTSLTGASIMGVTGSGSTYTVTVNTGTATGCATLRLDVVDNDSIQDVVANKLGGTGNNNGNFVGQFYTVDRANPTVSAPPPATVTQTICQ